MTIYVLSNNNINNNVNNNAITNTNDTSTIDDQKYKNCIKCLNDSNMNKCRIDLEDNTYIELYKIKSKKEYFLLTYYSVKEKLFNIYVVIDSTQSYTLEISCDNVNYVIKKWDAGDKRFELLKTFFIEIRKFLFYLKITTKLQLNYNPYDLKKQILFSIERDNAFDNIIQKELFIKFSDIGFASKKSDRHYKCELFYSLNIVFIYIYIIIKN